MNTHGSGAGRYTGALGTFSWNRAGVETIGKFPRVEATVIAVERRALECEHTAVSSRIQ